MLHFLFCFYSRVIFYNRRLFIRLATDIFVREIQCGQIAFFILATIKISPLAFKNFQKELNIFEDPKCTLSKWPKLRNFAKYGHTGTAQCANFWSRPPFNLLYRNDLCLFSNRVGTCLMALYISANMTKSDFSSTRMCDFNRYS